MKTSRNWNHRLRRLCAASIAGILLCSPQVQAAPTTPQITVGQAEQRARTLFGIPKNDLVSQRTYTRATELAPSTYAFTFSDTTRSDPAHTISVQINAQTGDVVSYAGVSTATTFKFPLPVSAHDATRIAIGWAKKLFPSQYAAVEMRQQLAVNPGPLTQPVSYQFVFERKVDGIPAPFNGFALTLDQNGTLTQVYDQWNDVTFPPATHLLSVSQANLVYKNALRLTLGYEDVWTTKQTSETRLVYEPAAISWGPNWDTTFDTTLSSATPAIDAKTGQILSATGTKLSVPAVGRYLPVQPGGPTTFPGPTKVNWTEQQAMNYVMSLFQIPSDMSLLNAYEESSIDNSNSGVSSSPDDIWSFTWTGGGHHVYASVNATHGLLSSYSGFIDRPKSHTSATQAGINAAAAAFVKRLYPHDTGALAVVATGSNDATTRGVHRTFTIVPLIHGIPVLSGLGQFTVDGTTTLKVVSFNVQSHPGVTQLADPSHAIKPAQAAADWIKNSPLHLQYLIVQPSWLPTTSAAGGKSQSSVVLVYAPDSGPYASDLSLDALTQRFNGDMSRPVAYAGPIRDLPKGRGAAEIRLLLSRGLLTVDAEDNVYPSRHVTRGDFVRLVVDAFGATQVRPLTATEQSVLRDVPANAVYHDEIATAVERGWIDTSTGPFQPTAIITRSEAAQLIADALGYRALRAHPSLFRLTSADASSIPPADLAADAICVSLGILPLQNHRFDPNGQLLTLDAAVAVVQMANLYANGSLGVGTTPASAYAQTGGTP